MATARGNSPSWRPILPGFETDAIPFALRTALSILLAYAFAFAAQIQAASTAGICVAIVAQPSAGMAFSKARYRLLGTVLGGVVAVLMLSAFPQDRTMLLIAYGLWLGVGTFVGTLLRDFRSYGAVLSGYTAGIIAIAYIDAPQSGFLAAMDRVAAILVGISCVLVVNLVFDSTGASRGLVASLKAQRHQVAATVAAMLEGAPPPDDLTLLTAANALSGLRSQATFAGSEQPDGWIRSNGARHVIESLLKMLTTVRAVARAQQAEPVPEAWRAHLDATARVLRSGGQAEAAPPASGPVQVLLGQACDDILALEAEAMAGMVTLADGGPALPPIKVQVSYDWPGALIGALRSCIAIGLISAFTVVAGWGGATLLLIQGTAIIALLAASPNPTQASLVFAYVLPPLALVVGVMKYVLMPLASGFVPFALLVGPLTFALALVVRHRTWSAYGPAALLFMPLLLSPTNPQTFDFSGYCNTALELALATFAVLLTFQLILPVSQRRRLWRVATEIERSRHRAPQPGPLPPVSLLYDRLGRVQQWMGQPTLARRRLVGHLYAAGELELTDRTARHALDQAGLPYADMPRDRTAAADATALMQRAETLLGENPGQRAPIRRAVAAMAAGALILRQHPDLLRFGRRLVPRPVL